MGGESVTNNYRFSLSLPPELEEAILNLRQTKEFRRCSLSEIVRRLIEAGLKASGYPKED